MVSFSFLWPSSHFGCNNLKYMYFEIEMHAHFFFGQSLEISIESKQCFVIKSTELKIANNVWLYHVKLYSICRHVNPPTYTYTHFFICLIIELQHKKIVIVITNFEIHCKCSNKSNEIIWHNRNYYWSGADSLSKMNPWAIYWVWFALTWKIYWQFIQMGIQNRHNKLPKNCQTYIQQL